MRKFLILLIPSLLCVLTGAAFGAAVPIGDSSPALVVTSDSAAGISFHVEIGRLEAESVDTAAGAFARVIIPGFQSAPEIGLPELPKMNRLLAVPQGAVPRITVANVRTRTVRLADYGVPDRIYPAQPSLSKSADPAQVAFRFDAAAYAQQEIRPELVRLNEMGTLRAVRIGRLEISPVTYFPAAGELEIVESLDVTVTYDGADALADADLAARTASPFFDHLYDGIAGANGIHDGYPDLVRSVVTMVIVTPPEFVDDLADFVRWKTERGFHTILAVTGTPEVGTTNTEIQAYLHGLYNNATPELPAPSFVALVGDVEQLPTFQTKDGSSDRPYCAVDDDLMPDMYYGRLSAANSEQLRAILAKTLAYDQFTMPDSGYLSRATLIAGADASWAASHGNGQVNYGTTHYFNPEHGITAQAFLYPESFGQVEGQVIQGISDGLAVVNYTAHGGVTMWSDPAVGPADVQSLVSSQKYALAIGNCCQTGTFDYGECLGETWLRTPGKGAVGYIGSANFTYWNEDYWWAVGFHPATEIDGTAYPVESTGLGAFDGLFHENGELETQYYVTNDALVFAGNLAVTESGSLLTEYYWNMYNLLGDPSLATYIVPRDNPAGHPSFVYVGDTTVTVTADPGSYVGLSQGGVLAAAGSVDATGTADLEFLTPLVAEVPLKLVVTAQNRFPYTAELLCIEPATLTVSPLTVPVNTATDITVTVLDSDGTSPLVGIDIWAEGFDYATTPVATDASGTAVVAATVPYGPDLEIVGQDPAATYLLFRSPVSVEAPPLSGADLRVETSIALGDTFAVDHAGSLIASVGETGSTLFARLPDGSYSQTADTVLVVTPTEPGEIDGIIAVPGFDLYRESFPIITAFGTLAGAVSSGGQPLEGAIVNALDDAGEPVFSVVTDAAGAFAAPDAVAVGEFTLHTEHFGYVDHEQIAFVNHGANSVDLVLDPSPTGVLSGTVLDAATYEPLEGTVRAYRVDNGELISTAPCDAGGNFSTGAIPYYEYEFRLRADRHVPVALSMTINRPETVKSFVLTATKGDVLLIDDGPGDLVKPAKFGGKTGDVLLGDTYEAQRLKSVAQIDADLERLGYYIGTASAATVDPDTFSRYDVLILTCGDNVQTLQNAVLKQALIDHVAGGGHLLLEGGELGFNHFEDPEFAATVLHVDRWHQDDCGDVQIAGPDDYVVNHPNALVGPLEIDYLGYGDSDAMVPLPDAGVPMSWTGFADCAGVITYDPNPAPAGGQIVYFAFNYQAAGPNRFELLDNAVAWLVETEIGSGAVSGQAALEGITDFSGITISTIPPSETATTDASGAFALGGLFSNTYQIRAEKTGYATCVFDVTLAESETVGELDLYLPVSETAQYWEYPDLPTLDFQTVSDTLSVETTGTVSSVAVYLDISHTWRGDLVVRLTAPDGTAILLQNQSGGMADDLLGWYPTELDPLDDLRALTGRPLNGEWRLDVADTGPGDSGVVNSWCLQVIYAADIVSVAEIPLAVAPAAGGMKLSWSMDPSGLDGFHVYRRTAETPYRRLTSEPLPVGDGELVFLDRGEGVEDGDTVFYSYTVVRAGRESDRVGELETVFSSGVPRVFALHRNYPNPFNPTTTIRFDLPEPGHVRLTIFDVSGRRVATLVDEERPAAAHTVVWNGTDDRGGRVASGAYYCRLETEQRTATEKLMLIK